MTSLDATGSPRREIGWVFLLVLAIFVLVLSWVTALAELRPFTVDVSGYQERFADVQAGNNRAGLSYFSQTKVLETCLEVSSALYGLLQPRAARDAVIANCREEAEAIAAETPTNALAWFVGAYMAAESGDDAAMLAKLKAAHRLAPNEQWLAELRVRLAEDHFDRLDADYLQRHEQDLAMLVVSQRGIASIAERWVSQEDFRRRITAIVETLPERDQARFVYAVRTAAGSGTN